MEGSTVITLKESYLKTLGNGTHKFTAEFTNGYADLTVTVSGSAAAGGYQNPATGRPDGLSAGAVLALAAVLAAALDLKKRGQAK